MPRRAHSALPAPTAPPPIRLGPFSHWLPRPRGWAGRVGTGWNRATACQRIHSLSCMEVVAGWGGLSSLGRRVALSASVSLVLSLSTCASSSTSAGHGLSGLAGASEGRVTNFISSAQHPVEPPRPAPPASDGPPPRQQLVRRDAGVDPPLGHPRPPPPPPDIPGHPHPRPPGDPAAACSPRGSPSPRAPGLRDARATLRYGLRGRSYRVSLKIATSDWLPTNPIGLPDRR